jgi:hypothetical protein
MLPILFLLNKCAKILNPKLKTPQQLKMFGFEELTLICAGRINFFTINQMIEGFITSFLSTGYSLMMCL